MGDRSRTFSCPSLCSLQPKSAALRTCHGLGQEGSSIYKNRLIYSLSQNICKLNTMKSTSGVKKNSHCLKGDKLKNWPASAPKSRDEP